MKERQLFLQILRIVPKIAGVYSIVLGSIVLFGWYTKNSAIIQVLPTFAPMQYNTALGFMFSGIGMLFLSFGNKRIATGCGVIVVVMGFLTFIEYIFNLNIGIDELFMKPYLLVKSSHPARMAPNTAFCFFLYGFALISFRNMRSGKSALFVGTSGLLIHVLGGVAILGYLTGLEGAYGWGQLTRMAVHTATGFAVLGIGLFVGAWRREIIEEKIIIPSWGGLGVFIYGVTLTVAIWHVIDIQPGYETILPEIVLGMGFLMTILLSITIRIARISLLHGNDLDNKNIVLENEVIGRKRVEEELFQYACIVSSSSDMIALLDTDYVYLSANNAYLNAFGMTKNEVIGHSVSDVFGDKSFKEMIKKRADRCLAGEEVSYESWFLFPLKGLCYMLIKYSPYFGKNMNVKGLVVIARDISQKKQAEEALSKSEEQFRLLVQTAISIIIHLSPEGKIIEFNPEAERLFGYKREAVLGKIFFELFIPEISREYVVSVMKNVLAGEPERGCELGVMVLDGSERIIMWNVNCILNSNALPIGITMVGQDITKNKQIEKQLHTTQMHYSDFINTSSDAYSYWNVPDGLKINLPVEEQIDLLYQSLCIDANRTTWEAYGFKSRNEILGKKYNEVNKERTIDKVLADFIKNNYQLNNYLFHETIDNHEYYGIDNWYGVVVNGRLISLWIISRNITEQKQAELALKESEARMKEAQRIAQVGNWELNLTTNSLFWSDEIYRMFGVEPRQFEETYEGFLHYVHPADRDYVNNSYTNSLKKKTPYDIIHRLLLDDGTVKYVNERCETFYDDTGEAIRSAGTVQDITERINFEKEIHQSEKTSRALLNAPTESLILLDVNGLILDINEAGAKRLRNTPDELIGKCVYDYLPEDLVQSRLKYLDEVVRTRRSVRFEDERSGKFFYHQLYPVTEGDEKVERLVVFSSDITKRKRAEQALKQSEKRFRTIFEESPLGIAVIHSESGQFQQINKKYCDIVGYKEDEMLSKDFQTITVSDDLQADLDNMKRLRNGEINMFNMEKRYFTKNGEIVWVSLTCVPLWDAPSEQISHIAIVEDITERKKTIESMIQSEKMLTVGGLAAGMAHEINNPLAGILQNVEVMNNRLLGDMPKYRQIANDCGTGYEEIKAFMEKSGIFESLADIRVAGKRASKIIKDMLHFSRKSEGSFFANSLPELMDSSIEIASNDYDLKKKYDFRNIKIFREYEENMPMVCCDSNRIEQVFLNIIKNGAEAMARTEQKEASNIAREQPHFIIRIKNENQTVRVEIEDNGTGIPENIQMRIFEPFFTTKSVGVGTGLGLYICYFIVKENHHGNLSVESFPGKGTKFIINLPIERK